MWFDTWSDILRILILGTAAYVTLMLLLRLTGKRTLSQLNAFDFIVTVALGSTLATILLSDTVSWADGATALALLVVLQLIVAGLSSRRERVRRVITAEPQLLLQDGMMITHALKSTRVTESEIRQVIRASGYGDLDSIAAVVLETNGKFSVIPGSQRGTGSALTGVKNAHPDPSGR
ncbi:DUF421 domain-containing protein [Planctomonas psychrotolerans]|uniref:DUF421 domain-containing protein n=1 Tax=Planctomonas psychrotolerans TaxID=2528712 RepID=UPI001238F76C|nr:YetF domain-containing protein [Planctomonas psychrotolerans]